MHSSYCPAVTGNTLCNAQMVYILHTIAKCAEVTVQPSG